MNSFLLCCLPCLPAGRGTKRFTLRFTMGFPNRTNSFINLPHVFYLAVNLTSLYYNSTKNFDRYTTYRRVQGREF